jgi:hypothetical protein
LFQLAEHALDAIAIPVAAIVGMLGRLAVGTRRDDGQDAVHQEVLSEGVAIVAFVGQERLERVISASAAV